MKMNSATPAFSHVTSIQFSFWIPYQQESVARRLIYNLTPIKTTKTIKTNTTKYLIIHK